MNALARFYSIGAEDADRRVAAALQPAPLDPADRYVKNSALVTAVDRATRWLRDAWRSSTAGRVLAAFRERMMREPWQRRYQAAAVFLLTATVVHVMLVWLQGPRPGWFWMIVPAMAALFAGVLLAGSRSTRFTS